MVAALWVATMGGWSGPVSAADSNTGGQYCGDELPGGGRSNDTSVDNPYRHNCGGLSLNGNGQGDATGRPCAGCVGSADDKYPPGQAPGGSDANNGYECDGNSGIGKTNPAHTGCVTPRSTTGGTTTGTTGATGTGTTGMTGNPTRGTTGPTTESVQGVVFDRPAPNTSSIASTTAQTPAATLDRPTAVRGVELNQSAPAEPLARTGDYSLFLTEVGVGLVALGSVFARQRKEPEELVCIKERLAGFC